MNEPLILASGSKTRRHMLEQAGVAVEIFPATIDEAALKASLIETGAPVRDIADALADAKARSVSYQHPDKLILAADQILVQDDIIYSKAKTKEAARHTLQQLSGKQHQLVSAAVVYDGNAPVWRHVSIAKLQVRDLSDTFIDWYLDKLGDNAFWSVGCYQLEGLGAQLFEQVDGDFFTVLGLPLVPVLDFLRRRGMLPV